MKLTRLRLLGFKSFVEPTDFLIEPGLTGVVGPNGCGKSNLVEALRWVMGESSHKAMRAAEMNDVIFSGTNGRPARNMAEVGMVLDNTDRTAPAAFNDEELLEISRRIVRDEGSNYRINGRDVRARDVQILFADASTGSRSPALVHQGRIGEIIQAKPEQRRRVLEEAAGIAGLHVRRHESELRLRAAEQNLARVEDVIGQLAAQIDGLKRQARQAVRYKAVAAQIRKTEATLHHLRHMRAMQEVAEAIYAHEVSVRLVGERATAQAETATRQAMLAADLPPLREAEAAAAAGLQRLNAARDALDRDEARARERLAELERRLAQLESDGARERTMIADSQAALDRLNAESETLRGEIQARVDLRTGADSRVAEAVEALAEVERVFGEVTREHADLNARRNRLESERRAQGDRLARLSREIDDVRAELARLNTEAPGVDLDALAATVAAAVDALAEGEATHRAAEQAHGEARNVFEQLRTALNEAERRAQRLDTEARTISKLLAVESKNLWPPVMDSLAVEKGYEKALGAALGDDLDAPCDASAPMRWSLTAGAESDPALPEGIEPLSRFVQGPAELARRLAQIGVATREQAAALASHLHPGQRLVSLEGDLWRWDGFAADAHAPTGAARRLAERGRLSAIEAELATAREEAEAARARLVESEQQLADAVAAQSAAREAWRALQREADQSRERHAGAERELSRHAARRSALDEADTRLAANHAEIEQALAATDQAFAELPPLAEIEARLADVRGQIETGRGRAAEARAEAQALAREAELADRRLQGIARETEEWRSRHDSAERQVSEIAERTTEATGERDGLRDAPAAFEEKRRALLDEIRTAEEGRRAAADRLATAENGLAEADRAARAALEALSAAREESGRAEERTGGAQRRLADIVHEIRESLETEPAALAALAEIGPDDNPVMADVEAELEKLRRDRERLGAVNLRAEEELREVEAQHTTLTTERDDLIEAIKRLRQGIQGLNREARERLLASFEVVNAHFQRLFMHLFGGGTAELHLIENDDPLLAGLEIIAKPPGKKPQTLSLLSGGEQALTALALIFAVFLTNPAPICVLDEVDAPLDDHNVERFCDLLHEMTKTTDTRFVIITHNPITMARMNRLYGVTMAERGVSQLVSVDLEGAVRLRDAV